MKLLAVTACAVAAMLATGCNYPVKVTGGGKALGTAFYPSAAEGEGVYENVPATASGQAILTEPEYDGEDLMGFAGKGNLQFVDHVTGMCFHAKLTFGGAEPGLIAFPGPELPPDFDAKRMAYAEGPVRLCTSADEVFDDGMVNVWIYDANAQGPDKGDTVVVDLYDAEDVYIYSFSGYLESGNYKVRILSTE